MRRDAETNGRGWSGRGRPADGSFTKRAAEAWLREVLREAEAGTLPGAFRTGATFADAAAEWLRYGEHLRRFAVDACGRRAGRLYTRV